MRTLLRHLQFQPHGERLLTSSAAFWLFSARVLVFTMAGTEAVAWGYLGFLFGEGQTRWVIATLTAATIFLVIWMVDASLVTLDRSWSEHAKMILGQKAAGVVGRTLRDVFTFGMRISLLLASLTVTAPYLAQVVFHKDIQRHINAEATQNLDAYRKGLNEKYDSREAVKAKEIAEKRSEYEREVAGKGPSGRYGMGPAAQVMLANVSNLEAERSSLVRERATALQEFDGFARDWAVNRSRLAAAYNVALPEASIMENRKALDELRKRPENRSTELAIKSFLGIIFGGLLLLKLFEPTSVRLYLSEVLQQEFHRYRAGTFDSALPATERSTADSAAMSPQRLYEFLLRVWLPARRLEEQQAEGRARTAAAAETLELLDKIRTQIDQEVTQARTDVRRVLDDADEANRSLTELHSAIAVINADLETFRAELITTAKQESTLDEKSRLEYRSYLNRRIAEADRALHELNDSVPVETEKFHRSESALKLVEERLHQKEAELGNAQLKIRDVRDVLVGSAGARARSMLSPAG